MKPLSMNARFITLILACFVLPFMLSAFYWYDRSEGIIEMNTGTSSLNLIKQVNNRMDDYILDLDKTILPIITDPLVQQLMTLKQDEYLETYSLTQLIREQLFPDILASRADVASIGMINTNRIAISSTSIPRVESAYDHYLQNNEGHDISRSRFSIMGLRTFENDVSVITVYREIFNPDTQKLSGLLVVDIRYQEIYRILDDIGLAQSEQIGLLDKDNSLLYFNGVSDSDENAFSNMKLEYLQHIEQLSKQAGYFISNKSMIIFYRSEVTNWLLCIEVPLKEVTQNLSGLRNLTLILVFVLGLIAIIVMGVSNSYMKLSFVKLQRLMKKTEQGNLQVKAPPHKLHEINELYQSFNRMVEQMDALMINIRNSEQQSYELTQKNLESHLAMLQSQINPHFLYNTIEVINSMAIEADQDQISRMTNRIASLFRYNAGAPRDKVTLTEEIQHVNTYLSIQKERFGNLQVEINLDMAWIDKIDTIRFTVQPIIENIFLHGYEKHNLHPGYIQIDSEISGDIFILKITDHGKGMSKEVKNNLNYRFKLMMPQRERLKQLETGRSGIGLWNVHSRIRLTFGNPYGLYIAESNQHGTTIHLKLPWRLSNENSNC